MSPIILVADDEPSIRTFLTTVLTRAGFQVTAVPTGTEAIAALLRDDAAFAIAILDRQMKPVGGLEVITTIRAAGCRVPILLISGSYLAPIQSDDPTTAALAKPFRVPQLLEAIAALLPPDRPAW